MNASLPKLNLDNLKSRSPDLEIIDLDADKDDDSIHLSENCNKEEVGERLASMKDKENSMSSKDRNNNSNGNISGAAAVGDQVKGLARCFRTYVLTSNVIIHHFKDG